MALYVIADLHLPLGIDKPMDVFGAGWANYVERLEYNWQGTVGDDDTVVIPGDFSWATYLEESRRDFEFLNSLNIILKEICNDMKIEDIRLKYNKTYGDDILLSFKNKLNNDLFTKTTNIGIHRDDFSILLNDLDAREFASNGQARTIIIAIKLALKKYITNTTGNEPVLLLDDVFAALDKNRIESITRFVNNSRQAFITTTQVEEIPKELLKNALIIHL